MKKIRLLIAKGLKIILNPSALRNCRIEKTAKVCAQCDLNNVELGGYSYIGYRCFAVNADIGRFCSISDNCRIGNDMHPLDFVSTSPVFIKGKNVLKYNFANHEYDSAKKTIIENDVWIGANVLVKSGVTIHNGAVVGMGSVVTKDIPAYEVWAGNPAHFIKKRFEEDTAKKIESMEWWNWSDEELLKKSSFFNYPQKLIQEAEEIKA